MEARNTSGNPSTSGALAEDEAVFRPLAAVTAAPEVDTAGLALVDSRAVPAASTRFLQDATARKVYANLPLVEMHAPVVGPAHPFQKDGIAAGMKNHRSGYVEDYHTHAFHFDSQYNTFHSYGYATAPRGEGVVGDAAAHAEKKGESVYTMAGQAKRRKTTEERAAEEAAKRARTAGAAADEAWALEARQPWADKQVEAAKPTAEQMEWLEKEGFLKDEEAEAAEGEARTLLPRLLDCRLLCGRALCAAVRSAPVPPVHAR